MAKSLNKTVKTSNSVIDYIQQVPSQKRQQEAAILISLFEEITGEKATMWGDSIIGFGDIHMVYASGRHVDSPRLAFSPRKQDLSLYFLTGFDLTSDALKNLGTYRLGKGCLYVHSLTDIHLKQLALLCHESLDALNHLFPMNP